MRHLRSGQRAASTWAAAANLGLVHVGEVEHDGELLQVEVGQLFPQPRHLLWRVLPPAPPPTTLEEKKLTIFLQEKVE